MCQKKQLQRKRYLFNEISGYLIVIVGTNDEA